MQAWTNVVVTDKEHPRTGTAGTCQGQPFTGADAAGQVLAQLLEDARAAHEASDKAAAAAAAAKSQAKEAADLAKRAQTAADAYAAEKGANTADLAPCVSVKFDADGATETVAVSSLQVLG